MIEVEGVDPFLDDATDGNLLFDLGGDPLEKRFGLAGEGIENHAVEVFEEAFVDEVAEEGDLAQLRGEAFVDKGAGELVDVWLEIDLPDLILDEVLVEELGFDNFGHAHGEVGLATGNETLESQSKKPDGLAGPEEHLDGEAVGEPADSCPDKGEDGEEKEGLKAFRKIHLSRRGFAVHCKAWGILNPKP